MSKEDALEIEFKRLKNSQNLPIVKCEYINNNKKHWKVVFKGSQASPYEDGYFIIEVLFNNGTFPTYGPECKFITKMFHPNVSQNGHICINLLNEWNSKRTMEDIFFGILEIMDNPVAEGGYDNEAKKLLEQNPDEFYKIAEEYTEKYAMEGF